LLSSLDVYTGSNITITGFKASLSLTSKPPSVRKLAGLTSDFIVDSWTPTSGMVILRASSNMNHPIAVANQIFSFGLEIDMPISTALALTTSPVLTIEAKGLGSRRSCCCSVERMEFSTQVLVPRPSGIPFFAARQIGQSTCFPGECNTITITIAVNTAVNSPTDSLFLIITGLNGVDLDSMCNPSCNTADFTTSLQDSISGSNHRILFQSVAGEVGKASWNSSEGYIKMSLANQAALIPFREYTFSLVLRNGFKAQSSEYIQIAAFLNGVCMTYDPSGTTCSGVPMNQMARVEVCMPSFNIRSATQSFPWPGCDDVFNRITII